MVTLELKHPAARAGMLIAVFAGLVAALLWLMPKPFTRLEYMIAGTAATALTLVVMLLLTTRGAAETFQRMLRRNGTDAASTSANPRTVRRSGQSS